MSVLWTAYREGAFGKQPRPFVGWLILDEDAAESRKPVTDRSLHVPVFKEFQGASYLDRYNILCQRLMQQQLYSAACVIASGHAPVAQAVECEACSRAHHTTAAP